MRKSIMCIKAVVFALVMVHLLLITGESGAVIHANVAENNVIKGAEPRKNSPEVERHSQLTRNINDVTLNYTIIRTSIKIFEGNPLPNAITRDFYLFFTMSQLSNCPSGYFRVGSGGRFVFNGGEIFNGKGDCIIAEDGGMAYLYTFRNIEKVPSDANPDIDICTFRAVAKNGGVLYVANAANTFLEVDGLNADIDWENRGKFYRSGANETITYYSEDWIIGEDRGTGELKLYRGNLDMVPPVALSSDLNKLWIGPECKLGADGSEWYKLKNDSWWSGMSSITFGAGGERGELKIVNATTTPVNMEDENEPLYIPVTCENKPGATLTGADCIQIDGIDYYAMKAGIMPDNDHTVYKVYAQKADDAAAPLIPATTGTDRCQSITLPRYPVKIFYEVEPLGAAQKDTQYQIKHKDLDSSWQEVPPYDLDTSFLGKPVYVLSQPGYQIYEKNGDTISGELEYSENGRGVTKEFYTMISDPSSPDYGKEYKGTYTYSLDTTPPIINSVVKSPDSEGFIKDDITLSVTAEDNLSGLAAQAYSFDGGTTWQAKETKVYSATAHLAPEMIWVRDVLGNVTKYDTALDIKIDKLPPVLLDDTQNEINGSNYLTSLNGHVVEEHLESLILYEGDGMVGTPTEIQFDSTQTFTVLAKARDCQYTLVAVDEAGNQSESTFKINGYESDLEVSQMDGINIKYGEGDAPDEKARLELENTAEAAIQINEIELDEAGTSYFTLENTDLVSSIQPLEVNTTVKIKIKERLKPGTYKGTLTIRYTNSSGRKTYETLEIEGSIAKRNITVYGLTLTRGKVYDKTVKATVFDALVSNVVSGDDLKVRPFAVYDTPDVGINKKITVSFLLSGNSADCYETPADKVYLGGYIKKAQGRGQFKVFNRYEGEKTGDFNAVSESNGIPKVYYKKADESDSKYLESVLYIPEHIGSYRAKAVFEETNNYLGFVLHSDFTITRMEPPSDIYQLSGTKGENGWYTSDVVVIPKKDFFIVPGVDMSAVERLTYTKTTESAQLNFERLGGAKAGPVALEKIKIDKTAPECKEGEGIQIGTSLWQDFLETVTFGKYESKAVNVTIKAHDPQSGIAEVSYLVSDGPLSPTEVTSSDAFQPGDAFTLDRKEEGSCVIYAKIKNEAGLVTYLSSDGMVIDKNAPVITGVSNGERIQTNQVTVSVADYSLDRVILNGKAQKMEHAESVIKLKAQKQDTDYTLEAYDKCGNSTTVTFTICKKSQAQNAGQEAVVISKEGKIWLEAGILYSFSRGKWRIGSDSTVYQGETSFYISKNGEYSITKEQ